MEQGVFSYGNPWRSGMWPPPRFCFHPSLPPLDRQRTPHLQRPRSRNYGGRGDRRDDQGRDSDVLQGPGLETGQRSVFHHG